MHLSRRRFSIDGWEGSNGGAHNVPLFHFLRTGTLPVRHSPTGRVPCNGASSDRAGGSNATGTIKGVYNVLSAGSFGLAAAVMTIRYQSLVPGIIAHAMYNSFITLY
jgi:membrane protease YdiL (CAAX protease family)